MTAPTQAPPRPDPGPPDGRVGMGRVWTTVGVAAFLLIALMWIWIFSGAPKRQNPDYLDDREWVADAEATCQATQDTIDERTRDAGTQDTEARADAIDASTDDVEAMLAALRDPLPETASDREVVEQWLADYDDLVEDRREYADAVRVNPDARFLTTEKFDDPLNRVVQTFAEANDMHACIPPGDVG